MPNRMLRDGLKTSERVAAVSFEAETLYCRLLLAADDFGLFDGRPVIIRANCMPLRDVTLAQVESWLAELAAHDLIVRYERDGKPYVAILRFGQRTRAKGSKFPLPTDDWLTRVSHVSDEIGGNDGHVPDKRQSRDGLDGDGDGDGDGERAARSARATRLPADWQPSEHETRWATDARPDLNVQVEASKFRDYWHAKAGKDATKLDWTATWRNWLRNAHAPRQPSGAQPPARAALKPL